MSQKRSYSELTHPSMREAIRQHSCCALRLAVLVAEFAQHIATAYEHFSKEMESVITLFRKQSLDLQKDRPVDTPSTIFAAWESLLKETEIDAQAHLDVANLLIKNVCKPLEEVATHKSSQAQKLYQFRELFENVVHKAEEHLMVLEKEYHDSYHRYKSILSASGREAAKVAFYNAHNDYVLQLLASNQLVEEVQNVLPQILEEIEEIHIDTCNTINVAIESHALVILTKATEEHRRFDELLKICNQVNPQLDVSCFVRAVAQEQFQLELCPHQFNSPPDINMANPEESLKNQLIIDRHTESTIRERRQAIQKEAAELTSYIKQNQDVTQTLVNMCQRNLANHLYAKVYETQEDMCRKRNEIRLANMQLAAVRAQIEVLSPKQNGALESSDQDTKKAQTSASIKGMWKKAFKSLKSNSGENKPARLSKKGSFIKRKDSKEQASEGEAEEAQSPGPKDTPFFRSTSKEPMPIVHSSSKDQASPTPQEIDPVYSLLKCAADLPKASRACGHSHCGGHHTRHASQGDSGNASKNSSPSSSAVHSPKSRRKKLNARMKSFSLDTPDPPKQLLAIDESTKKKSSSYTNTCFGGGVPSSPVDPTAVSTAFVRRKLGGRSSSLEMEEKHYGSHSPSPHPSPVSSLQNLTQKSQRKKSADNIYLVLYHFKGKEKDDLDLRAGWRMNVLDSSKRDWWKGKCNGKIGYFPSAYVERIQPGQRVFQVTHPMHLSEGDNDLRLHKDQIVMQVGPEEHGMIQVKSSSNRQAMCPLKYLQEI